MNDSLANQLGPRMIDQGLDLRDIHLPDPPAFWPPAPGWWLLALLLLLLLVFVFKGFLAYRQRRQQRREILQMLEQLPSEGCTNDWLTALSTLLKRVALSRFPPEEVAPLSGEAWLDFLDRTGGGGRFAEGPGRLLSEGLYAPESARPDCDAAALRRLARDWLRRNL